MTRALQAIIFDFDGVIANSEPLHFTAFKQALDEDGIDLSAADYYAHYLGFDDVGVFRALGRDRGLPMAEARVSELVARKGERLQELLAAGSVLFPGAAEFIRQAAAAVPVAIASGALRHEIEEVLEAARACVRCFAPSWRRATPPKASRRRRPTGGHSSNCAQKRARRSTPGAPWLSKTRAGVSNPHGEPGYAVWE